MADDTETAMKSSVVEGGGENGGGQTAPPSADDKSPKGRKGKVAEPKATQAEPTAPRARDPKSGLELDEHGLPLSGPARRRWLAAANIEDPALKKGADEQEHADG